MLAIAANPDDALPYLMLASLYTTLIQQTRVGPREAAVGYAPLSPFPPMLRRVQIATALHRALALAN